jgi:4-amino-4-deoxy-L-arabinose transferase-like glycosyltransferase
MLPTAERWLPVLLWLGIFLALFYQLGGAGLFEPDEGRNAEKAREILVLNDWVTPHENFHAVLDKPIFFYSLVALAFKLFGVSEWAARLPSALAALGCIVLVYRFAYVRWGHWTGLWSALILVTCAEFFIMARVVILDMVLTFCVTVSLCAFYQATHVDNSTQRHAWCAAMYVALGVATLIKGLIGIVVPGLVIFFFVLLTKQWKILRRIDLLPGTLLFLAVVLPWYLQAEANNAGFLKYYIWEEHFGRFVTNEFNRGEPWYYFIFVALVGFMPWALLLPWVGKVTWKVIATERLDHKTIYLLLWIALPFLFFSVSKSKLPHYILPIFPALALLTASALVRLYQEAPSKLQFALSLTWWVQSIVALFFLTGWFYSAILPRQIRVAISSMPYFVWVYMALSAAMLAYFSKRAAHGRSVSQRRLYLVQAAGLSLFVAVTIKMMVLIAPERSAKPIAEAISSKLTSNTQVVQYDTYLAGLAFYLQSQEPLWLVTRERKKRSFLGNYYEIGKQEDPTTLWGRAILSFEEFQELYQSTHQPVLIVVKEKNLPRLAREVGESPRRLAVIDEYLLVSKR